MENMPHKIQVQVADFDPSIEYQELRKKAGSNCGAIVSFVGLVRDSGDYQGVNAIELEHYPGMTEKSLETLMQDAASRWPVLAATIIHRIGKLELSEQIVYVGVASQHRLAAFEASEFLMDTLKTTAPFWKKEYSTKGSDWVKAKQSDQDRHKRWS